MDKNNTKIYVKFDVKFKYIYKVERMSVVLNDTEIAEIIEVGYSKETIDGWLAHNWTREEILELLEDEWAPGGNKSVSECGLKNGQKHCPICNELFWVSTLNPHIFKAHMVQLLEPYNKPHNKDRQIQQVTVPLEITCPVFHNEDKPEKVSKVTLHEYEENRVYNPKTKRFKKIVRTRPDPIVLPPQLYYCLVCSKSWTSEKSARKHFVGIKGLSDCTGAKQLIKINYARGIVTPNYENYAKVSVRVPDVSLNDDLNKEVSILELREQIKKFKEENRILKEENQSIQKKLKDHITIGIRKDEEIQKLTDKLEFAEGEAESWKGKYEQDIRVPINLNSDITDSRH